MTTEKGPGNNRKLPGLAIAAINAAIVLHLLALTALALSPASGPWFVPYFANPNPTSEGPQFAKAIAHYTTPYLQAFGLNNNYHFESNRTDLPTIYVEEIAPGKDRKDKLPDPRSNMWVRGRQRLLINALGMDSMYMPRPGGQGISRQDLPKIPFFSLPHDAVIQKLMRLKDNRNLTTKARFLTELASVLTRDELDRYRDEVLGWIEQERFQVAQTFPNFDRTIKAEDVTALNNWLDKNPTPPDVLMGYFVTDKVLQSVRNQQLDAKTYSLYEATDLDLPKVPQIWTAAPISLTVAKSIVRYLESHGKGTVELVRMNRSPLAPLLMFPHPESPGKLLIDEPPPAYNLDIIYHSFGNGHPKPWFPQ